MQKITTGIKDLDGLIDHAYIGDNVVWEVESGTSVAVFIQNFIRQSLAEEKDVIYVSFNRSLHSILPHLQMNGNPEKLTILDCFTSGKGKSDRAFLKFYETAHPAFPRIVKVDRPGDIASFSEKINTIQDQLPEGARYIFDSLTGMQDLWGNEDNTYKFFTYMCPRLYDLSTVAYWILEKEAHSQAFKANLRHITQVVLDLYKKRDRLYIKALKLEGRANREAFKPHSYEIEDSRIAIMPVRKEPAFDIGGKIKDARTKLGMSQKELADKIGMTSSFVSQLENNQISPSLASFMQIADALGISPALLLQKGRASGDAPWLIKRTAVRERLFEKDDGYSLHRIISNDKASAYLAVVNPGAGLDKHFLTHKKEELICVIKGEIAVRIDGRREELLPGDSVYLTDAVPSQWSNQTNEEAELLVICI